MSIKELLDAESQAKSRDSELLTGPPANFDDRSHPERVLQRARQRQRELEANKDPRTKRFLRRRCHKLVERALKSGRLRREPCKVCGAAEVEAHHHDYSQALSVIWLCKTHHDQITHKKS